LFSASGIMLRSGALIRWVIGFAGRLVDLGNNLRV